MHDDLTPRERLAKIVAEETGDGRRIVRFLVQVAEGELDHQDFKPCHRMDAAKELVKVGLTEFSDYIHANSTPSRPRANRTSRPRRRPVPRDSPGARTTRRIRQGTHPGRSNRHQDVRRSHGRPQRRRRLQAPSPHRSSPRTHQARLRRNIHPVRARRPHCARRAPRIDN